VVIVLALFASGESSSKLGPAEGVLDPVREGDCRGDSLTGEGVASVGDATRAFSFSWPVTASEIARRLKFRLEMGFTGNNQSVPLEGRLLEGDLGEIVLSYGAPSNFVTVGEGISFGGGSGLGGALIEFSEGVLRRPFTDKP
jgi:hypothetical protein